MLCQIIANLTREYHVSGIVSAGYFLGREHNVVFLGFWGAIGAEWPALRDDTVVFEEDIDVREGKVSVQKLNTIFLETR